jgi:hypothetical protein
MFKKTNLLEVPYGTIFETEMGNLYKIVKVDRSEFGSLPDNIVMKNIKTRELTSRNITSEKDLYMTIDQNISDKIIRLLVLAGPSGVGKSNLERDLIELFPDLYHKLKQMTTRPQEENSKWIHVQKETFKLFEPVLIGKLYGYRGYNYGTIPDFKEDYINTIILAQDGIYNLLELNKTSGDFTADIFILGIDSLDFNIQYNLSKREKEYWNSQLYMEESKVFKLCDYIFKNKNGRYITPFEVEKVLYENAFYFSINPELINIKYGEIKNEIDGKTQLSKQGNESTETCNTQGI